MPRLLNPRGAVGAGTGPAAAAGFSARVVSGRKGTISCVLRCLHCPCAEHLVIQHPGKHIMQFFE